jgi:hypothetical protein
MCFYVFFCTCLFLVVFLLACDCSLQSESESLYGWQSVSQSVCLSVEPTLWTFDQILLPFQVFGSEMCCVVSVGLPLPVRVRVRVTLRFTACQSVCLGIEATLGLMTTCYFPLEVWCLKFSVLSLFGRPLWQEVGSVICQYKSVVVCLRCVAWCFIVCVLPSGVYAVYYLEYWVVSLVMHVVHIELNLLHIQIDPNTGRKKKPLDIERVNNNI